MRRDRLFLRIAAVALLLLTLLLASSGGPAPVSAEAPAQFAPLDPSKRFDKFSFVVYGDIQDNFRQGHQALVRQMLTEQPQLVFNTGDISEDGGRGYERRFYPVVSELVGKIPFLPTIGNHDIRWNRPDSRTRFYSFFQEAYRGLASLPGNGHLADEGNQKLWYSFLYSDTLFVVLDSNFFIDEGRYRSTNLLPAYAGYREEQLRWIRDLLRNAAKEGRHRATFIFMHHSPFASAVTARAIPFLGIGGHPGHCEMLVNLQVPSDQPGPPLYLLDLFRETGVTAVFSGHEHYYERWEESVLEDGRPMRKISWIVTGLAGVKPRKAPAFEEATLRAVTSQAHFVAYQARASAQNAKWTSSLRHAYPNQDQPDGPFDHYALVTVDGSEIRFETKDTAGKVRDQGSFTLAR